MQSNVIVWNFQQEQKQKLTYNAVLIWNSLNYVKRLNIREDNIIKFVFYIKYHRKLSELYFKCRTFRI